ncbi:MAG: NAD-dependent epimerase/dehydratase [Flammeovirgaceae bacterium]|nr:NAD-dependent epimerase/dehydratase [Flammeovirgaceae bacterium]
MKILITGGAGYIGSELTEMLASNPEVKEIVIYDNLSRNNYNVFIAGNLPSGKIRFEYGDILDTYKLKQVIVGVDVVFHLAAKVTTPFANEDPHIFEQVNHWGTAELSYVLEESDVKQVYYLSSTSVYGTSRKVVDMDSQPNPRTHYGISKMHGEKMIERLSDRMETYVLRCGNVYGYGKSLRFDAVINRFMFDAHFHNRIQVQGSGLQKRAFIHISKICSTLAGLIQKPLKSGVYNLVDKNYSVNEIVDSIKGLYPNLETLGLLSDFKLRTISVLKDKRLEELQLYSEKELNKELEEFSQKFSFTSI